MEQPYGKRSVTFEGCDGRYLQSVFFWITLVKSPEWSDNIAGFLLRPHIHQLAHPINHRGRFQGRVTAYIQHTCRT